MKDLVAQDLKYIWHPCTQMKDHEHIPLIPIKRGKGIYLFDFDEKKYIDGISSWWVNLFGHSHPYISQKLASQAQNLEHVLLAGFTHQPIIELSSRLCALLGNGLQKCFFADNGSSAVEVALKMSFHQALLEQKQQKTKFLSLKNSYHGETLGALSVGNVDLYKKTYSPLLLECLSTSVPMSKEEDMDPYLCELEVILKKYHHEICAFILEPLIQCAGSMNMYSADFVKASCEMARSYGVDIIFDEIAVGFGRSGSLFAFEQCGVVPDFICLSKGITGGYLPLSVVITHQNIYDKFYAPYEENKAFLHSHSYTGNPLACACANAVLDLFESENTIVKNKALSVYIAKKLKELENFVCIKNTRYQGMVFAFDLISELSRAGVLFFQKMLDLGVILRPLGNTIYFMPPYVISEAEVDYVFESIQKVLRQNFK